MKDKQRTLSWTQLGSALAVVVSIIALLVSLYETRLMNKQYDLMMTQHKTSVWPHLSASLSSSISEEKKIRLTLTNKGIGPAMISEVNIFFKGTLITSYDQLNSIVASTLEEDAFLLGTDAFNEKVLSPEEKYDVMLLSFPSEKSSFLNVEDFTYQVCYCSVYQECWNLKQDNITPSDCGNH